MRLIDADAIPWFVEEVGVITKEEIDEMPTVEAIPIEWIANWMGKHQGLEFDGWNVAVGTMVHDWAERKEE